MKLVKCKSSNRFLIKDECYEVISINYYDEEVQDQALQGFKFLEASVGKGRTIHYKLVNHTDKIWITSWYHECNFYTFQEIRDNILNKLEI
jgi:hypothetical protein